MKHSQGTARVAGMMMVCALGAFGGLGALGCGKKEAPPAAKDAGADAAVVAPALPPLGAEQVRRYNYAYGEGAAAFGKATAAYKAKPRDWAAARTNAEAALAKDDFHLEAHRMVAAAMAQDGDYTSAIPHLVAAMAGDWQRQGAAIAADADLAGLMASPAGAKVDAAAAAIKAAFLAKATTGLWLLGRRSTFKLPDKAGVQAATTRGELYAYDRESKRYLRISQTDHQVAGFLISPSSKEVVLVGYDKLEVPGKTAAAAAAAGGAVTKPDATDASGSGDSAAEPAADADPMPAEETEGEPPLVPPPAAKGPQLAIARGFALLLDATTLEPIGKRTTLPKGVSLAVGYGPGDQILAVASDEATSPTAQWLSIDFSAGKTTKTEAVELQQLVKIRGDGGDWQPSLTGLGATAETPERITSIASASAAGAEPGTGEIQIPGAAAVSRRSLSLAPEGKWLAFATDVDPCNPDVAPSLYVAARPGGALKHLLTGKSHFATRWLDATTLAYEDPEGGIRLWDATTGRESLRLSDKGGLALAFLSASPAVPCATAPVSPPKR